jgi:elongation factor P
MLANDLRKGMALKINNDVCIVRDTLQRTQGRGSGWVQLTLRNMRTGNSQQMRMASTDKVETVPLNREKYEFSYADTDAYYFMHPDTFETIMINKELVGEDAEFLTETLPVDILDVEGSPIAVELPAAVELEVTEAPEAIKGDTVNNPQKTVTLETGKQIQAPMFIKQGEKIKVNTSTGEYMGRA